MALPLVQPIIPTFGKEPFDGPEWLFDFKYDGFRALCYLERRSCRFISRNGNVLNRFDALTDQVPRLLDLDGAILDGEVIAPDETGRPRSMTSCGARGRPPMRPSTFCGNGADLRPLPLSERRRRL
ncbi:MAG: hypothetical protein JO358_16670 [Alphaproteobacteria bacterium]|nr:hypothetical protein [Alphaproteobacteria bacterium]